MPAAKLPRTLLILSDARLEILMADAHPLAPAARSRFLAAVAGRLAGAGEIGDGAVSRVCRDLQRGFFDPPDFGREPGSGSIFCAGARSPHARFVSCGKSLLASKGAFT
jgi:hypothetical protein